MNVTPILDVFRKPQSIENFGVKEWQTLLAQGYANNMMARITFWFKQHDIFDHIPSSIQWHFDAAWHYYLAYKDGVLKECAAIQSATAMGATPVVFLKGTAYLLQDLVVAQGRLFSDVDILTSRSELTQTEQFLLWNGWQHLEKSEYDQSYYRAWMHELPPFVHLARGTTLDLHHNIVPPISGRSPDITAFPIAQGEIDGLTFSTFSPAAMTLHSIVHLFFEEDFSKGFRDLNDIHLLFFEFGSSQDFWQELLSQAEQHNFMKEVALACYFSEYFFHSTIPPDVRIALSNVISPADMFLNRLIFKRLLAPKDGITKPAQVFVFAGLLRGHLRKMPLPILIRHTAHKISGMLKALFSGQRPSKNEN